MSRPRTFFCYSDSPDRRTALSGEPGTEAQQYLLYGLRRFEREGVRVAHNLVGEGPPSSLASRLVRRLNRTCHRLGAYGGDFPTVMRVRRDVNHSDVVVSTVDSVGIPLVILKRIGRIRPPLVYVSIGLPCRINRIRREPVRRWYRLAFRRVARFVAYGWDEAAWMRSWLSLGETHPPDVTFVPFGVDVEYFQPQPDVPIATDILSVGRDSQRDYAVLVPFARARPDVSVTIITDRTHAEGLGPTPRNVRIIQDVPFSAIRQHFMSARVVALPVKENTYSGATTTLLQAMALAKPVVVSRVGAIRDGYGLVDGQNCRLVQPGDTQAFGEALSELLAHSEAGAQMGLAAREHVERNLSWERYEKQMMQIVTETAAQ